jgi:glycosyltransferase involved in cell wall biosynthesis
VLEGGAAIFERGNGGPLEPPGASQPARLKAVFLYHNSRDRLLADVWAGKAPDTGLLGSNHLSKLGIDARAQAPRSQVKHKGGGLRHRLAWNVREVPAAWELDGTDVVCSFWTRLFPLIARLRGRPAVIAFNVSLCTTYLRSSPARRKLMGASLRSAAAVVCFASAQREQLLSQHGLDPDRVHMVPLGVDERFYRPRQPPDDGYVLAVGADMARDFATFARAVERLDARTILVAPTRNLSDVKLPQNVELRRRATYPELRELYAGAACVVIPTRREGYQYGADCSGQTVLVDAMAMGRPVVASERATLSDYVRDQETALIVPPEDPEALAAALEQILSDREHANAIGAAGRRYVEEGLTTRHLAARLAPIIREAAAS